MDANCLLRVDYICDEFTERIEVYGNQSPTLKRQMKNVIEKLGIENQLEDPKNITEIFKAVQIKHGIDCTSLSKTVNGSSEKTAEYIITGFTSKKTVTE